MSGLILILACIISPMPRQESPRLSLRKTAIILGVRLSLHYTGIAASSPVDVYSPPNTTGSVSPWASSAVTTTQANDLLVGTADSGAQSGNCSYSASGNWTQDVDITSPPNYNLDGANGNAIAYAHQIVSSIQTNIQNTGTNPTGTCNNYAGIAAFKAAASGPPDTTPPSVPTNLTATAISSSQINLSWTASTDPDNTASQLSYKVYRNGTQVATTAAGTTAYSDTGLAASTNYSYTVAAQDPAGNNSAQSTSASATTQAAPALHTYSTSFPLTENPISEGGKWVSGGNAPGGGASNGPTNMRTTGGVKAYGTQGGVGLGYDDSVALLQNIGFTWGRNQYTTGIVYLNPQTNAQDPEVELQVNMTMTSGTDFVTGYNCTYSLKNDGSQYFTIGRFDGAWGVTGAQLIITTGETPVVNGDSVAYSNVGGLISMYHNGVLIESTTDHTYTGGSPGIGTDEDSNGGSGPGIDPNFGFSSFSANDGSSTPDTTPPSVPTNLSATAISSSQINLSWTASTDNVGVTGYKVYRGGIQVGATASTNYSDTGLAASTLYSYTVSAYDAANNNSNQSAPASATTQAAGTPGTVIDPSRSIDWSAGNVGVAGGIPNRSTVCATLNPGATAAQINTAIANCASGGVVFLNAGIYNLSSGISLIGKNNITLRGAGPDQTKLIFGGSSGCIIFNAAICLSGSNFTVADNAPSFNWTAGYVKGATQITVNSTAGMSVGSLLVLDQLNDATDNGNLFVEDAVNPPDSTGYSQEGGAPGRGCGSSATCRAQHQYVKVTAINGNTVTITPGLYMPNWRASQNPGGWIAGVIGQDVSTLIGVEACRLTALPLVTTPTLNSASATSVGSRTSGPSRPPAGTMFGFGPARGTKSGTAIFTVRPAPHRPMAWKRMIPGTTLSSTISCNIPPADWSWAATLDPSGPITTRWITIIRFHPRG